MPKKQLTLNEQIERLLKKRKNGATSQEIAATLSDWPLNSIRVRLSSGEQFRKLEEKRICNVSERRSSVWTLA